MHKSGVGRVSQGIARAQHNSENWFMATVQDSLAKNLATPSRLDDLCDSQNPVENDAVFRTTLVHLYTPPRRHRHYLTLNLARALLNY